jgi:hypothetical protein
MESEQFEELLNVSKRLNMNDNDEIIVQPTPYGRIIKYTRFGIVLIFFVSFFLCIALNPYWHIDYEPHKTPNEPIKTESPISNTGSTVANIVLTITPASSAPLE